MYPFHLIHRKNSFVRNAVKLLPGKIKKPRQLRHFDTCQLETIIECDVPRIKCDTHGVKRVDVPWAGPGSRLTLLFEAIVIKWLEVAPILSVAERLNLDWNTVLRIQKQAVEGGLARRGPLAPKNFSTYETSEKKGHNYLTIVSENRSVPTKCCEDEF